MFKDCPENNALNSIMIQVFTFTDLLNYSSVLKPNIIQYIMIMMGLNKPVHCTKHVMYFVLTVYFMPLCIITYLVAEEVVYMRGADRSIESLEAGGLEGAAPRSSNHFSFHNVSIKVRQSIAIL